MPSRKFQLVLLEQDQQRIERLKEFFSTHQPTTVIREAMELIDMLIEDPELDEAQFSILRARIAKHRNKSLAQSRE